MKSPLVAFILPQFHRIPENDAWWGEGFTDWTNVKRGQARFPDHEQPHIPGELGYYDLMNPQTRQVQADLAQQYGISAFCYYHYWFSGRRLLERPVQEILRSGQPVFPFCLCWANEPWTRAWDGGERDILMPQNYSSDDDRSHIQYLLQYFQDRRYWRIDGKPLFLVYRASHLPDPKRTTDIWRDLAHKAGLELFLARVESFHPDHSDPRPLGFDAAVEFAPDRDAFLAIRKVNCTALRIIAERFKHNVSYKLGTILNRAVDPLENIICHVSAGAEAKKDNYLIEYQDLMDYMLAKPAATWRRIHGVCPGWDNSVRRKTGAVIVTGSTPERYEYWLKTLAARSPGEPIFLNAWNEWAEGCHLEPDRRWGRAYLEATARAMA